MTAMLPASSAASFAVSAFKAAFEIPQLATAPAPVVSPNSGSPCDPRAAGDVHDDERVLGSTIVARDEHRVAAVAEGPSNATG